MEAIFPANPIERVGYYGGRINHELWGEPLNLASEIALIVFMLLYFVKLKRDGLSDQPVYALVILAGLVGLGGAIFHAYPTRATLQIDLLPIKLFGLAYVLFAVRRFFGLSYKASALMALWVLAFTLAFESAVQPLRIPGLNHLASIVVLVAMGLLLRREYARRRVARLFLVAAASYLVALFFRYLDFYVYRAFPLGSHFLWHLFAACVVVILLYAAAAYGGRNPAESLHPRHADVSRPERPR